MYDIAIVVPPGSEQNAKQLHDTFPFAKVYKRQSNKLLTINYAVQNARTKYLWVLSSHVDYTNFNFDFRPVSDQSTQIHAWQDNDNYNTFLIPVTNYLEQKSNLKTIDDYQYVNWHEQRLPCINTVNQENLDIFFVSNGENCAETNYTLLKTNISKSIKRIQNISNRTKAFQIAADQSESNWFFVVPAKLQINKNFNWSWAPPIQNYHNYGYIQHYIFLATNPLNNLEYGHMAAVAYNKDLVRETLDPGIDFTLSKQHDIINLNSGVGLFNSSPLVTWRTAFREVLKLKYYQNINPTQETEHRLNIWLTVANGKNADWCLQGAKDAEEYYNKVNGNYQDILQSYHWQWVDNYAKQKGYNLWK